MSKKFKTAIMPIISAGEKQNGFKISLFMAFAAFSTYFCMYAFRKPFTAATFEGLALWGISFKIVLVVSQVLGYMLSKFIGIRFISEMKPDKRAMTILYLIGFSELALFFFAVVPYPYNFPFLFFNGLPLGLIWGLVFSFLEGRENTEAMGAGLAVSFIISSGIVKSAGKIVVNSFGFTEFQMPFIVGLIFTLPLVLSVWMLTKIPLPNQNDILSRSERKPMTHEDRSHLFSKYAFGLVCLTLFYFLLTALRDFRDNFIVEIWESLGFKNRPDLLTSAELPVAIIVLLLVASIVFVKNNFKAFWLNHFLILAGCVLMLVSTWFYKAGFIPPIMWMILIGLGIYISYILFQSLIFERFMAAFREPGNVGFLMYVADAFGYFGSILVMFYRNFGAKNVSWINFYERGIYIVGFCGIILISFSWVYFQRKKYEKI